MITSILSALVTPAALATAPMNIPTIENKYDWEKQATTMHIGKGGQTPQNWMSMQGTQSFVGTTWTVDDVNQWD